LALGVVITGLLILATGWNLEEAKSPNEPMELAKMPA
jgi:hypothetical protein